MILSYKAVRREASSSTHLENRLDNISLDTASITQHLLGLSISLTLVQTSLVTLRSLSLQIMSFLRTFLEELQTLLQNITCTNMRMYFMLLSIYKRVSSSPTMLLQSNIRLEDALGVVWELPYEWFCY